MPLPKYEMEIVPRPLKQARGRCDRKRKQMILFASPFLLGRRRDIKGNVMWSDRKVTVMVTFSPSETKLGQSPCQER